MSRKRLGGWANERRTGIGVWKDLTRDHRLHLRGPPGRRRNLHLEKWQLSLRRPRFGICKRVYFIIVLPCQGIFEPPILISHYELFSLIGLSMLATFVTSSTLTPFISY